MSYRLMTAEMVGAEVIILDSKGHKRTIGIKGVVIEQSKNCYFIAGSKNCPPPVDVKPVPESGRKRKSDQMCDEMSSHKIEAASKSASSPVLKIHRIIKDCTVVGIILPVTVNRPSYIADASSAKDASLISKTYLMTADISQNICILHGKKFV